MRTIVLKSCCLVYSPLLPCGQPVSPVTQAPIATQETSIQPSSPPEEAATETEQPPTSVPPQMSVPELVDDFHPPTGLDPESPSESPGRFRLLPANSTDGMIWVQEYGLRMQHDPNSTVEGSNIKDPAVLQLADGSYLMVYVSRIPK